MSIDKYHGRKYLRLTYNCYHFASDVWFDICGITLLDQKSLTGYRLFKAFTKQFVELKRLTDPCIVVFQRPKSVPHVGIYIRGNVLHLKSSGVEFQPLHVVKSGYTSVRYVTCLN